MIEECHALLDGRYHSADGAPIEGGEGLELVTILNVEPGRRGGLSGGRGILLRLFDQRSPRHNPVRRGDAGVGKGCVEEGPQHAVWLANWHFGERGRPVIRDSMQDYFQ